MTKNTFLLFINALLMTSLFTFSSAVFAAGEADASNEEKSLSRMMTRSTLWKTLILISLNVMTKPLKPIASMVWSIKSKSFQVVALLISSMIPMVMAH